LAGAEADEDDDDDDVYGRIHSIGWYFSILSPTAASKTMATENPEATGYTAAMAEGSIGAGR